MDPSIDRILSFWFDPDIQFKRWFDQSKEFDNLIRSRFGEFVFQARTTKLDAWTENPRGSVAMLVLLDQFSRNIFRGSAESYSSDSKALDIAVKGLAKGYDRQVDLPQQALFYLPFVHNESLLGQVAAISLYENYVQRCQSDSVVKDFASVSKAFAERHREVIAMFGRFPARNEALGRESTVKEIQFLKENPDGL